MAFHVRRLLLSPASEVVVIISSVQTKKLGIKKHAQVMHSKAYSEIWDLGGLKILPTVLCSLLLPPEVFVLRGVTRTGFGMILPMTAGFRKIYITHLLGQMVFQKLWP